MPVDMLESLEWNGEPAVYETPDFKILHEFPIRESTYEPQMDDYT